METKKYTVKIRTQFQGYLAGEDLEIEAKSKRSAISTARRIIGDSLDRINNGMVWYKAIEQ